MKRKIFKYIIFSSLFIIFVICIFMGYQFKKNKVVDNFLENKIKNIHFEYPLKIYRINDKLQINKSSLLVNTTMKEILSEYEEKFQYSSYDECNILLFETLNNIDQNLKKISETSSSFSFPQNIYFIGSINGVDSLASKSSLAYFMSQPMHQNNSTYNVIPETYIFSNKEGIDAFIKNYSPNEIYILKKNIQRQEGIFISSSLQNIIKKKQEDKSYVICQKMLQNPLLVNNHKINLRIYLLIKITPMEKIITTKNKGRIKTTEQHIQWFIYKNGFVYYTPEYFESYSINKNKIITSGYIDRQIYEENPMTLHELRDFLGQEKYDFMYNNIVKAMQSVKKEYNDMLKFLNRKIPGVQFSLFGCDIAPDNLLHINILEINKGPDISYKDERDKAVKYNLIKDLFYKVGLLKEENVSRENHFLEV